ncbi:uncharacterized protein LOC141898993 [Tubulanus polymorphus]|uniref:uncharacterized protein LOC141898993 n=1 Tax=Tubulanus polymorphus TaxID=672921 RepID=UPI003DA2212B
MRYISLQEAMETMIVLLKSHISRVYFVGGRAVVPIKVQRGRCEEIGVKFPRLSLYLSSQLIYGILKIYVKQQEYFFQDTLNLSKRVNFLTRLSNINLPERKEEKGNILNDPLSHNVSVQFDDPFMFDEEVHLQPLPNLDDIVVDFWQPILSPCVVVHPETIPCTPTAADILRQAQDSPHSVQAEKITLIEPEISAVIDDQNRQVFEQDLPGFPDNDLLLQSIDQELPQHDSVLLSPHRVQPSDDQTDVVREPTELPGAADINLYPSPEIRMTPPQLPPKPDVPKKHKKSRKRLILADIEPPQPGTPPARVYGKFPIIDAFINVPKRVTSKYMATKGIHCQTLKRVSDELIHGQDVDTLLLNLPGRHKFFNAGLASMITRNYVTCQASDPPFTDESGGSAGSSGIDETASTISMSQLRHQSATETPQQQSIRDSIVNSRETSHTHHRSFERPGDATFMQPPIDDSDHNISMQPAAVIDDPIPEEIPSFAEPPVLPPSSPVLENRNDSRRRMKKCVKQLILQSDIRQIYFADLCKPSEMERVTVALWFQFLLECVGVVQLKVEQSHPFSYIRISPGRRWETLCDEVESS